MSENPYESPHEKTESGFVSPRLPKGDSIVPILGCALGGCVSPILAFIALQLFYYVSFKSGELAPTDIDPIGEFVAWLCYSIISLPIGITLGCMIELIIKFRNIKTKREKRLMPMVFPLYKK
jgi:hypothetical protein